MNADYKRLLQAADEAGCYEFPSRFDYEGLERRARLAQSRIHRETGEITKFEGGNFNQDASFSIAICFDRRSVKKPEGICIPTIRFSNFGNLVSTCWAELFSPDTLSLVIKVLQEEGFHYIPEVELDCEYDGVMKGQIPKWTWWGRYFDWV